MLEAPRTRPPKHAVLHTFAAHIDGTPDAVFAVLAERVLPPENAVMLYLADAAERMVVVQGGWWYRGEYRVVTDAAGSTLEHVILNVAQRGEKAALVAGGRVIRTAPLAFHELVTRLRAEMQRP